MPAASDESDLIDLKGCKILLVDDDRLNIRILRSMLQNEGYVLAEADSAESALVLYDDFQLDLVLLDVLLPGMTGFDACRELRKRHSAKAAPVMFITAKQEAEEIEIIQSFMTKQMDEAEVAAAVKEAVAQSGAASVKDMGKVMAVLKEKYTGKMDFSKVSGVVKQQLGG